MDPVILNSESHYLQYLEALTGEIEGAMGAIASDDIQHFAESVARQEVLASYLRRHQSVLKANTAPSQSLSLLAHAGTKLRLMNLKYAALLKYSSRTIAMLSSLHSTYAGSQQEAHSARLKHQTWSCEM